jgi:hypothetical protein
VAAVFNAERHHQEEPKGNGIFTLPGLPKIIFWQPATKARQGINPSRRKR